MLVIDEGSGIPSEHLPRVFEPFFTTKAVGEGTGLGLAMVHGVVNQHGGHIAVESAPNQGTTVTITLPAANRARREAAPARGNHERPGTMHRQIMVVEDEVAVRKIISLTLKHAGYSVIEAGDGREALRKVADPSTAVDLVVCDLVMPRLGGGRAMMQQLVQSRPGLPVLFVSGYAEEPLSGMDGTLRWRHLMKPFTPNALLDEVLGLLAD